MSGMSLLPEEFRGTQKQCRAFLPAHDVVPLIDEQRQVTVALNPFREAISNNSLARWANGQRLLQLFTAPTGNPGHFGRKTLYMLSLAFKKTARNEQRK